MRRLLKNPKLNAEQQMRPPIVIPAKAGIQKNMTADFFNTLMS